MSGEHSQVSEGTSQTPPEPALNKESIPGVVEFDFGGEATSQAPSEPTKAAHAKTKRQEQRATNPMASAPYADRLKLLAENLRRPRPKRGSVKMTLRAIIEASYDQIVEARDVHRKTWEEVVSDFDGPFPEYHNPSTIGTTFGVITRERKAAARKAKREAARSTMPTRPPTKESQAGKVDVPMAAGPVGDKSQVSNSSGGHPVKKPRESRAPKLPSQGATALPSSASADTSVIKT